MSGHVMTARGMGEKQMTNEDARMNLEKLLQIYDDPGIIDFTVIVESIKMALEALERQIPKKAVGEHYAHMRCPSCNHRIPSGGGSSSRRRDNWCNYCGQAIDWTENEG